MSFSDLPYQREHGRKPRGRGSWAFCPWSKHNAHDYLAHTIFSPGGMTLTEAKRWITKRGGPWPGETIVIMP